MRTELVVIVCDECGWRWAPMLRPSAAWYGEEHRRATGHERIGEERRTTVFGRDQALSSADSV